eukprot:TRINITY_DN759_c2_g1_i6.p1 TRINITY_DN759_c2_g1~~TRINITY_DN759_c2_g1_i6.p1  ORF type:complete len:247 (-),score=18.08 TRINITY_DN759_c2_g1_i6:616-1356(-)
MQVRKGESNSGRYHNGSSIWRACVGRGCSQSPCCTMPRVGMPLAVRFDNFVRSDIVDKFVELPCCKWINDGNERLSLTIATLPCTLSDAVNCIRLPHDLTAKNRRRALERFVAQLYLPLLQSLRIQVRSLPSIGAGLFAAKDIPAGSTLAELRGRHVRLSPRQQATLVRTGRDFSIASYSGSKRQVAVVGALTLINAACSTCANINVAATSGEKDSWTRAVATKAIPAGQQLLVQYGNYACMSCEQ